MSCITLVFTEYYYHYTMFLLQAGVAEADVVILRMPLQSLADNDADAQVAAALLQIYTFFALVLLIISPA